MVTLVRAAHPEKNVSVKLHLVAAHLIGVLEQNYSWSRVCEQGVEHLHSDFKKLHLVLAPIVDPIAKGLAFINFFTNENYLHDMGEEWNI